jgi:uncharacterized protein (TIGR00375 family)
MRIIADLQIHSKYSRACSRDLIPKNIEFWSEKKGIGIIGTGDFTHPKWLLELKENLEETRPGLYQLHETPSFSPPHEGEKVGVRPKVMFMLTSEISSIYKQGDKVRRIHNCLFAPNFAAVDRIVLGMQKHGANLSADGRPITGIHCDELVKIIKDADQANVIIPAHAWTPHFGIFGSLSGFDSIEEAFGDQAKHIFALETGLSSDPKMNWRLSSLDKYTLVSNSDAHSLRKIGREANAFEVDLEKLSYSEIIRIIKERNPKEFLFTIEFFPEEGKYHLDGHADCKFSCEPQRTKKLGGICPVCGKKLLVGVLNRVDQLADREYGFMPERSIPFRSVIPLEEIIAETFGVGVQSKKVMEIYDKMTAKTLAPSPLPLGEGGWRPGEGIGEFGILLDLSKEQIASISSPAIAEAVIRVRQGQVKVEGGYDGVFGKIHIYSEEERDTILKKPKQQGLF